MKKGRPKSENKLKSISVCLDPSLVRKIECLMKEERKTRPDILREMLTKAVNAKINARAFLERRSA